MWQAIETIDHTFSGRDPVLNVNSKSTKFSKQMPSNLISKLKSQGHLSDALTPLITKSESSMHRLLDAPIACIFPAVFYGPRQCWLSKFGSFIFLALLPTSSRFALFHSLYGSTDGQQVRKQRVQSGTEPLFICVVYGHLRRRCVQ